MAGWAVAGRIPLLGEGEGRGPAGPRVARRARRVSVVGGVLNRGVEQVPTVRFAHVARRVATAARAAGLAVPAFRSPPRRPGAIRTIRRLPGGSVVAVAVRGRPFAEVVADMVEGVVVANGLEGVAATRIRTALHEAVSAQAGPAAA